MDRFCFKRIKKYNRVSRRKLDNRELKNLALEIEKTINLLSHNPYQFQASDIKKEIRRVVVAKHNTLYYQVKENTIEIISFFSNRQSPKKIKLK